MALDGAVDLDGQLALVEDEKGGGVAALLHEVLPLEHLAQLEFLYQHLLELPLLDQRGKSEMPLEALQDYGLVGSCFFLRYLQEVLVDGAIVDGSERAAFFGLAAALRGGGITSSTTLSLEMCSSLRSTSPLRRRLSFRSTYSII